MKRVLFIIVAFVIASMVSAQVRVVKPSDKKLLNSGCTYDSLKNLLPKADIIAYVGQKFQVLPLREYDRRKGYRNIIKGVKDFPDFFSTIEHDKLCGKILTCTGAFTSSQYDIDHYYLDFKDEAKGDVYCYEYSELSNEFYFLVLGFKEKFEQTHTGKEYIFKGAALILSDFLTGDTVMVEPLKTYYFDEVIFNAEKNKVGYLYHDENKHQVFFDDLDLRHLVDKGEYERLVSLYGEGNVRRSMSGDYYEGMPVELLVLVWGKPSEINDTPTLKQYVYKQSRGKIICFYIEDGKVKSWN